MRRIAIGWIAAILVAGLGLTAVGQCLSEVEDNNSFALADRVAILPGTGCIDGSIGVVGDIDFFYFDLSAPRNVVIETITSEDTEIALLDSDANVIAQNDDIALNVYASGIEAFLLAGRYFIAVWEHNDDNVIYSYSLSVSASLCSTEVEDNDSYDLADYLGVVPGEVCATGTIGVVGDIDIFSFEVSDLTQLTISTQTTEDTEIALVDATGTVLAVNDDYVVGEYWSWIEQEVPAGSYYVVVREHGDDNVIYDYTLTVSGTTCVSEVEPNDEALLADVLGEIPGEVCVVGEVAANGDLDYFEFEVLATSYVEIWTESSGDTEIALFDLFGNQLAQNDDVSVSDTSSWIGITLDAGTYYVAVREFTQADWIPSYTLTVRGN